MNVIVTGASKGIGKSIAETFAARGHNLLICSRNEVKLYQAMDELVTRFPAVSIKARAFDLSRKKQAIEFGNWCLSQSSPDILVNNAGNFEPGEVHNEADGVLERQVETNLYSAYHLTRTVLPAMMGKKRGHIFTLCSVASLAAYENGGAYSISKFALLGLTKNLREEMKPYGIKVTAIISGAVMTDSWADFDNSTGRIMEPGDIASLVYACTQLTPQACVEEILVRPLAGDL